MTRRSTTSVQAAVPLAAGLEGDGVSQPSVGIRFVLVGVGGFGLQSALLAALTQWTATDYRVATAMAVELAVLHNFVWHDRWTWPRPVPHAGRWRRLLRFHTATASISVAGNVALMALFVGALGWPVLAANAAAVLLLALANFRVADLWVFAAPERRTSAQAPGRAWPERPGRASRPSRPAGSPTSPMPGVADEHAVAAAPALAQHTAPAMLFALLVFASPAFAGPPSDAAAAWTTYIARTERRIATELADATRFLSADFDAAQRGSVRRRALGGEVVVLGDSVDVPGGLIHHWHGYAFVPGVDLETLLATVTDPTGPRAVTQEDVLEARVLARTTDGLRLFLKLQRTNLVSVAYNTEHDVRYRHHRSGRASSRSTATRIAELEDVGLPGERERPDDRDRGFLWRMNSYWRYEAVAGGVLVELESLTLSRSLPWGVRSVVRPAIDHVARESIERTLVSLSERTRRAARAQARAVRPAATPAEPVAPAPRAAPGAS